MSSISELARDQIPEFTVGERCCSATGGAITFALFIISCVAAAGNMNGVVAGGCIVGLSIPTLLLAIGMIACSENKQLVGQAIGTVIQSIALIIIGSLTITGTISPITAGWCVLVPAIITLSLMCCCACCTGCIFGTILMAGTKR